MSTATEQQPTKRGLGLPRPPIKIVRRRQLYRAVRNYIETDDFKVEALTSGSRWIDCGKSLSKADAGNLKKCIFGQQKNRDAAEEVAKILREKNVDERSIALYLARTECLRNKTKIMDTLVPNNSTSSTITESIITRTVTVQSKWA